MGSKRWMAWVAALGLVACGQEPAEPPPTGEASVSEQGWPAVQEGLPRYELRLAPEAYAQLVDNLKDRELRVPATFVAEGQEYPVEVGIRGRSTRYVAKKSFQVRFNQGVRFKGLKQLELLASWRDGGHLTEKLWYDLARAMGLRASDATYVLLDVRGPTDGAFEGAVYLQLEAVTKDFLAAHGFDAQSDIYRCAMHDCELSDAPRASFMEDWDKRTNEQEPWDNLHELVRQVNRTTPGEFRAFVERSVDVEGYLKWMALQEVVGTELHQDSRSFLVQDRATQRWSYVPWDLNNALSVFTRTHANGTRQGYNSRARRPLFAFTAYDARVYDEYASRKDYHADMRPQWNVLSTRILDDEVLRARFLTELRTLLETRFRPEEICPRLDATAQLLRPHQLRETALEGVDHKTGQRHTFVDPDFLAPVNGEGSTTKSAWWLCQYVTERRRFLLGELERMAAHGKTALKVDAVGRTAEGAFFVELHNGGATPVDLGTLYLTGDPRRTTQWRMPAVSLPPGGTWRFVQGAAGAEGLGATLEEGRPEVALFAADGRTAVDLLFLPPLAPGMGYRRTPSGSEDVAPLP